MTTGGSALLLAGLLAACIDDGPRIDAASPTTVARGASVTLTGTRFCQGPVTADFACTGPVTGTVDLGLAAPVRAEIVAWRDAEVSATIPSVAPLGPTSIYLTSAGRSSNAVEITIE